MPNRCCERDTTKKSKRSGQQRTGTSNRESTDIGQYLEITSESISGSIENEYGCCCGIGGGVGAVVGVVVGIAVGAEPVPEPPGVLSRRLTELPM